MIKSSNASAQEAGPAVRKLLQNKSLDSGHRKTEIKFIADFHLSSAGIRYQLLKFRKHYTVIQSSSGSFNFAVVAFKMWA